MKNDEGSSGEDLSSSPGAERRFDLEERTARFGETIVAFARSVPVNIVTTPLVGQRVRSGTSVGANYGEANDAGSKKEFRHCINICRRESKECKHWLRMIAVAVPQMRDQAAIHWKEAKELNLIFGKIRRSCDRKG